MRRLILKVALAVAALATFAHAQSSSQSFATPVTTNEISGIVKARDVGDARLTTYYYTFEGDQGDLFVNVLTKNFTGDIDVFAASGMRPLTKIVVYADLAENETGRVIYLRKPEKIILRVEGRSPGDDDASFRIKFAGSFVASKEQAPTEPELPKANVENTSGITVNSVGTIIAVRPKPTPTPIETDVAAVAKEPEPEPKAAEEKPDDDAPEQPPKKETPSVIVTEGVVPETKSKTTVARRTTTRRSRTRRTAPPKPAADEPANPTEETPDAPKADEAKAETPARTRRTRTPKPEPVDPMANIRLVILFKDGRTIERPMSEVFKFGMERAILTVISKDGRVGRYPMIEISKVTIE